MPPHVLATGGGEGRWRGEVARGGGEGRTLLVAASTEGSGAKPTEGRTEDVWHSSGKERSQATGKRREQTNTGKSLSW